MYHHDSLYPWDDEALGTYTDPYSDPDSMDQCMAGWPSSVSPTFSDQENCLMLQDITGQDPLCTKIKKPRAPNRKFRQRSAANQRERRRMRTINDAFEDLRARIPATDNMAAAAGADRKLSKVDTLKFAIRYIQQLSDIITSCDSPLGFNNNHKEADAKVILRYHGASYFADCMHAAVADSGGVFGHSLSWEVSRPSPAATPVPNRLSTRLWIPEVVTNIEPDTQSAGGMDLSS